MANHELVIYHGIEDIIVHQYDFWLEIRNPKNRRIELAYKS
ncbi:hypothetical protein [Cytobacillus firmus]|nr:hypothetical protein [Cytobacillus firmus]